MRKIATVLIAVPLLLGISSVAVDYGLFGNSSVLNANLPSGGLPNIVDIVNDNGNFESLRISSYGSNIQSGSTIHFNRYYGTLASPTAIPGDIVIGDIGWRGADGSGTSQSFAAFGVNTSENWTSTHHGTFMWFDITQKGGADRVQALTLNDDGASIPNGQTHGNMQVGTSSVSGDTRNSVVIGIGTCGAADGNGKLCVASNGNLYYRSPSGTTTLLAPN